MALNPYYTQYFSRMTDPKFQQAQQLQNLFSEVTKLGGGLMAAGAPTTQPGQGQRLFGSAMANFGKDLAGSNQNMQNQMLKMAQLKESMDLNALKKAQIQSKLDAGNALKSLFTENITRPTATAPQATGQAVADEYPTESVDVMQPSADTSKKSLSKLEKYLGGLKLSRDQIAYLKSNSGDIEKFNTAVNNIRTEKRAQLNTEVKDYQATTKEIRKVINTSNMVDQFKTGNPVHQVAILYKFVTALDPNSAVKEGEVELSRSVMTMQQRLLNMWKSYDPSSEGAPVAAKNILDEMVKLIEGLGNEAKNRLAEKQGLVSRRLESYAIDPKLVFNPVQTQPPRKAKKTLKDFNLPGMN